MHRRGCDRTSYACQQRRCASRESYATTLLLALFSVGLTGVLVTSAVARPQLPDERGYELVSPVEKNGGGINGIDQTSGGGVVMAAPDGDMITYTSATPFGDAQGAPSGNQYISRRKTDGWSTENITTPLNAGSYGNLNGAPFKAFSEDLSTGLLLNGGPNLRPVENAPLVEGAPNGYEDYYLRANTDGGLQTLLTGAPAEEPKAFALEFVGATPDLTHLVLASNAALTPGAVAATGTNRNLYEWAHGEWKAINIPSVPLRAGETIPNAGLGGGRFEGGAVSTDGARVFFTIFGVGSALYLREDGMKTVEVDAAQGGSGKGAGIFRGASADGERVFFTDQERLTGDSTAGQALLHEDLYEYNTVSAKLTDVTVDSNPGDMGGASVQGLLGVSADGEYVYFVANGVLTTAANKNGEMPTSGGENLYMYHADKTRFIATLSEDDESPASGVHDWSTSLGARTTRVTADGSKLVFMSDAQLQQYDNHDAVTGRPDEEVYLYNASVDGLTCISCNPSGVRPHGASSIPGATDFAVEEHALYQSRVLDEDSGRVFFDSSDSLVPGDTNGQQDVYEFENGHASLISSGTSDEGSSFVDASKNGDDVFFLTSEKLTPSDDDELIDLYDARVGGGFAPSVSSSPCEGEVCRMAPSSPPMSASPTSLGFVGAGNLVTGNSTERVASTRRVKSKKAARRKTKGKTNSQRAKKSRRHSGSSVRFVKAQQGGR